MGFCCIAPVIAAAVLKAKVTVGRAEGEQWPYGGTVGAVEAYGGTHVECEVGEACVDVEKKVVSSPAYMWEGKPHEIHQSVGVMINAVMGMLKE